MKRPPRAAAGPDGITFRYPRMRDQVQLIAYADRLGDSLATDLGESTHRLTP